MELKCQIPDSTWSKAGPPLCLFSSFLTITINKISMKVTQKNVSAGSEVFSCFPIYHSTLYSAWMRKVHPVLPGIYSSPHSHGLWWTKGCTQNPKLTQAPKTSLAMISTEMAYCPGWQILSVPTKVHTCAAQSSVFWRASGRFANQLQPFFCHFPWVRITHEIPNFGGHCCFKVSLSFLSHQLILPLSSYHAVSDVGLIKR